MPSVSPGIDVFSKGVMVTDELRDKSKDFLAVPSPTQPVSKVSLAESVKSSADCEAHGHEGVKEVLGNYQRISVITAILFITCVLLSLSASALLITDLSDIHWQRIVHNNARFPTLHPRRTKTYFEKKRLKDIPIGKLIHSRKEWKKDEVEFGLDRPSIVHLVQLIILFIGLAFCLLHLTVACCFKRVRRNFQLISLGYGFVGLFVFTLCLTTLYFAFVHKVSSFLMNANNPPNLTHVEPHNLTIEYFVNLSYACAFAFSQPNRYAKEEYPYWPFPENAEFTIENVTYSKDDMMDLGICPRQDYLLIAVFLLAITSVFCWLAASYSETLENQILGPPVWLQRFKVKVHKGIRHWHTRTRVPSSLYLNRKSEPNDDFEQEAERLHQHPPHLQLSLMDSLSLPFDKATPTWDDAYDILDGGVNHIMLNDPFNIGASSHRLYRSVSTIQVLDNNPS